MSSSSHMAAGRGPSDLGAANGSTLETELRTRGFSLREGNDMRAQFEAVGPLADWPSFAASWGDLGVDQFMADGGRYRRRRHAQMSAKPGADIARLPHGPHYQGLDYNHLNGGIERWFDPITEAVSGSASLATILAFCRRTFEAVSPHRAWFIELHQFRIEAKPGEVGQPTPEGAHRDGVDFVLVLMIRRENVSSGVTSISGPDGQSLGTFTLAAPFDAAIIDDHRVYHGVTPVTPVDSTLPAFRDVLVVTFKAQR